MSSYNCPARRSASRPASLRLRAIRTRVAPVLSERFPPPWVAGWYREVLCEVLGLASARPRALS